MAAGIPLDWREPLDPIVDWTQFEATQSLVQADREAYVDRVYPPAPDVFKALELTAFSSVRAVILGQDPYPRPSQAHGLAFSLRPGASPFPGSLANILREVERDYGPVSRSGSLPLGEGGRATPQRSADGHRWPPRSPPEGMDAVHGRRDQSCRRSSGAGRVHALGPPGRGKAGPDRFGSASGPSSVTSIGSFGLPQLQGHNALPIRQRGTHCGGSTRDRLDPAAQIGRPGLEKRATYRRSAGAPAVCRCSSATA